MQESQVVWKSDAEGCELQNGLVMLRLIPTQDGFTQEYLARGGDQWVPLCAAERDNANPAEAKQIRDIIIGRAVDPEISASIQKIEPVKKHPRKSVIRLSSDLEGHQIEITVSLEADKRFFHILVEDHIRKKTLVEYVHTPLMFLPGGNPVGSDVDIVWVPHQRPLEEHVIADHSFRSPAVILQKQNHLLFMVPDLHILEHNRIMKTALDFEINGRLTKTPTFAYGFKDWVVNRHVYFSHHLGEGVPFPSDGGFQSENSTPIFVENRTLRYGYYLYLDAEAEPFSVRREALGFLWERYAGAYMDDLHPQVIPFEDYIRYMLDWAFRKHGDTLWQKLTLDGAKCGAALRILTTKGDRVDAPIYRGWFKGWHGEFLRSTVWDSNMRSALAYRHYGQKWENPDLMKKAEEARNFTLAAPQEDGIFPTIYVPAERERWNSFSRKDYENGHWDLSEARRPEGHEDYYHTSDCSYSGIWLLRWHGEVEKDKRILDFCSRYAEFLLRHQLPSGAWPAWIRTGSFAPSDIMKESAETSASIHFLSELYSHTGKDEYLEAAKKGAEFIIRQVIPSGKWEDFETYFSCATLWRGKKIGEKDPHTGVYPHNTLSIHWAADALYSLYQATGDERYLREGINALDQLCLYQQVWDASFLSIPTFGGFCSQNTDGEWSDLRTALFALTLLDYYRATGKEEYFERGIAALRSCFVLLFIPENNTTHRYLFNRNPKLTPDEYGTMWENMAHGGTDLYWNGDQVNFHWFMAPAVAAAHIEKRYGAVYINLEHEGAFGIDGCKVVNLSKTDGGMDLVVQERMNRRRTITVRVDTLDGRDIDIRAEGDKIEAEKVEDERLGAAKTSGSKKAGGIRLAIQLEPMESLEISLSYKA